MECIELEVKLLQIVDEFFGLVPDGPDLLIGQERSDREKLAQMKKKLEQVFNEFRITGEQLERYQIKAMRYMREHFDILICS